MSPLHHHFEKCGWKEVPIVILFSAVTALLCVIAFFATGGRVIAREYQIIFLTEDLAKNMTEFLKRFDEEPYPVVVSVPSGESNGYGMEVLKNAMERALGVDILFNN